AHGPHALRSRTRRAWAREPHDGLPHVPSKTLGALPHHVLGPTVRIGHEVGSHHQPEEPPHQPAPHPFIPPFPGAAPEPVSREPVPPRAGSSRLSPGAAWDLAGDDGAAAAPVQHPIVSSTPSIPRGETP